MRYSHTGKKDVRNRKNPPLLDGELPTMTKTVKEELKPAPKKDSNIMTAWSLMSIMQGLGPIAIPYAVKIGGYLVLLDIVVVAFVMHYTNKILVRCQYANDHYDHIKEKRVGYKQVAHEVWKQTGTVAVISLQLIHSLAECSLCLLLVANFFETCFGEVLSSKGLTIITSGIFLLPTILISNPRQITWLNLASLIMVFITFFLLIGSALFSTNLWNLSPTTKLFDRHGFWIANGIVMFNFVVHPHSIQMEDKMETPQHFDKVAAISFSLSAFKKLILGVTLTLQFGSNASQIISSNIDDNVLRAIVSICFAFVGYYSYSRPSALITNLIQNSDITGIEEMIFPSVRANQEMTWEEKGAEIVMRFTVLFLTVVLGVLVPDYALLMALFGCCSVAVLCIVFPAWFYYKLTIKANFILNLLIIFAAIIGAITGVVFTMWKIIETTSMAQL